MFKWKEVVLTAVETPLFERLRQLADKSPGTPAVTCGLESLTRGELVERAEALAKDLRRRGVEQGDFVAIVLRNGLQHLIATFAAWAIGATPQPLNPSLSEHELREILELSRPRVTIGADPTVVPPGTEPLPADHAPADDGSFLQVAAAPSWKAPTSGGSTGRPKVILAGGPGVWEQLEGFAGLLQLPDEGGASLVTAPMSHNAPFVVATLSVLRGAHVVVMPRFDAEDVLRHIEQCGITWVYAVPTMMVRMRRLPEQVRNGYDVSRVRVLMHMAAPCSQDLKRFFIDWFGADSIWELYAGTEVQAATVIRGDEWLAHPGSVGRPVTGEIQVRDDELRVLAPGETGRIWMRRDPGAPPTYRYLGATPVADAEGWETLGDIGWQDEDGYLYLGDRDTDMILVGGVNVYPAEIEAALLEHPAVVDACVVGRAHEELGEVPHAFVRLGQDVTTDELLEHARARLASYKAPRSLTATDQPLRDDAGKVRRSVLKASLTLA